MVLKLSMQQKERLKKITAGKGNRAGLFTGRNSSCQITAEQIMKIKECTKLKMSYKEIKKETGMSEHHIRYTKNGKYDHMLKPQQ